MAEVLGAGELLDGALLGLLGPLDAPVTAAIVGICNDALEVTVGTALLAALGANRHLVPRVAPWVADLASGLVMLAAEGPGELPTVELLQLLGGGRLEEVALERYGEAIDLSAALTYDRVLEQVLGPGAGARDPRANEASAPWLGALRYGHRIHLVAELLRLLPAG